MDKQELVNIEKIGIIMFGLLGDVLIRTAVVDALYKLYPKAKITAICDANTQNVLINNPSIDSFILFDRNNKSKLKKNIGKIKGFWSVRKEKFDLLVDLYNGGSSPFIVSISGARYRLGYNHQKDKKVYNLRSEYVPYANSKIDSFNLQSMSILQAISDKTFPLKPRFYSSFATQQSLQAYIDSLSLNKSYLLNLGAGSVDKLLENEKYLEIVKYIYAKYNYTPAIVLNPGQEYLQENFIGDFLEPEGLKYVKLKSLSIDEIAVLIQKTEFIITPDTGIMHLSFALETFVYTAFTYTNPELVDLGDEKFIPVYESFEDGALSQRQDIQISTLLQKVDILFQKINNEK